MKLSFFIKLFKKFLKEVPSDGYIEFFRTQDFAGSFLSQNLDSLLKSGKKLVLSGTTTLSEVLKVVKYGSF